MQKYWILLLLSGCFTLVHPEAWGAGPEFEPEDGVGVFELPAPVEQIDASVLTSENESAIAYEMLQDAPELCSSGCYQYLETDFQQVPPNYYVSPSLQHRLQLEADLVALSFDGAENVFLPTNVDGENLSSGDFDSRFDAGFQTRLRYTLNAHRFVEASWLGDIEFGGEQRKPSPGGLIELGRQGNFSNFEALFGHEFDPAYHMPFLPTRVIGLIGASGIQLDDSIHSFAVTAVENSIWGVVGGLRALTQHSLNTSTKFEMLGGIFSNDAELVSVGGSIGAQTLQDGQSHRESTAFIGRVSLDAEKHCHGRT